MAEAERIIEEFKGGLPKPVAITQGMILGAGLQIVSASDNRLPKAVMKMDLVWKSEITTFLGIRRERLVGRNQFNRYVTDGEAWVGFEPGADYGFLRYDHPQVDNQGKALTSSLVWRWGVSHEWVAKLSEKAGLPLKVSKEVDFISASEGGLGALYHISPSYEGNGTVWVAGRWMARDEFTQAIRQMVSGLLSAVGSEPMVLISKVDLEFLKVAAFEGDASLGLIEKVEALLK